MVGKDDRDSDVLAVRRPIGSRLVQHGAAVLNQGQHVIIASVGIRDLDLDVLAWRDTAFVHELFSIRGPAIHRYRKWSSNIWEQPLSGGKPKPLTRFTSGQIFYFTWTLDRTRMLMARGSENRDPVLLRHLQLRSPARPSVKWVGIFERTQSLPYPSLPSRAECVGERSEPTHADEELVSLCWCCRNM